MCEREREIERVSSVCVCVCACSYAQDKCVNVQVTSHVLGQHKWRAS